MPADLELVADVRRVLAEHADPTRAPDMQRYMKSALPYRGVTTPVLRTALRPLTARAPADRADWEATIRLLWDQAAYREERYADAADAMRRGLEQLPDSAGLNYNYACFATLAGETGDETFARLRRSVELFPPFRKMARSDDDLDAVRDDPRFEAALR